MVMVRLIVLDANILNFGSTVYCFGIVTGDVSESEMVSTIAGDYSSNFDLLSNFPVSFFVAGKSVFLSARTPSAKT